jgi:hypothetical protein
MGVLELQDPLPFIMPFETVPLPVNSMKFKLWSASMNSRLNVPPEGSGFEGTPIRTPCPVLFAAIPGPEMEPCPELLLAIKQTVPSTENVPTGVITLQGLETNSTW